jgi:hypothetical protein
MSSLERNRPLLLAVLVVVDAAADVVVAAAQLQLVPEPEQPQGVQQHPLEHLPQTQVVDVVVVAADVVVQVEAAMPFPHFVVPQLNHGFHSNRGLQPSTITTRQTR